MCNEDRDEEPTNVSFAPRSGHILRLYRESNPCVLDCKQKQVTYLCIIETLKEKCKVLLQEDSKTLHKVVQTA